MKSIVSIYGLFLKNFFILFCCLFRFELNFGVLRFFVKFFVGEYVVVFLQKGVSVFVKVKKMQFD